jgi:hypothetical protein
MVNIIVGLMMISTITLYNGHTFMGCISDVLGSCMEQIYGEEFYKNEYLDYDRYVRPYEKLPDISILLWSISFSQQKKWDRCDWIDCKIRQIETDNDLTIVIKVKKFK